MAQTGYTPILIYSSSTASNTPAVGNLTNSALGSELAINITDGKLFYKDNANAIQVIGWKVRPVSAGGTGLTSLTAGDMLYYTSGTALTALAIGATGRWLGSSGTAPQWNAPAALTKTDDTNVTLTLGGSASTALLNAASLTLGWTGQLATSRGGTGLSSFTANGVLYASSTSALTTSSALTFDGTNFSVSTSGNPTYVLKTSGAGNNPLYRLQADTNYWDMIGVFSNATDDLRFRYNGSDFLTILNTGKVYVNSATAPVVGSEIFGVAGGGAIAGAFGNTDATQPTVFISNSSNTTNTYVMRFACGSGGNTRGEIYYNGSAMVYATSSDYRLKENVRPLTNALGKLAQLKPKSFKWIEHQIEDDGFLAHEFKTVFPQSVGGEKDEIDEQGKPKYQTIDASSPSTIAAIVAGILELKQIVDAQAAEIAALKGN